MGFLKKLNKTIKDTLDIDIEKEAKQLIKDTLDEVGIDGSGKLLNTAKGLLSGLKGAGTSNSNKPAAAAAPSKKSSEPVKKAPAAVNKAPEPAKKAPESTQQTKAYTSVRSTHFVKTMAEQYLKESVAVDSKGDVTATLTAANKKPIRWTKKYSIFPDAIVVESESLQYPKNFNSETFVKTLRENKDFKDAFEVRRYNDNTFRLIAEITTDDGTEYFNELLKITMLMHGVHQLIAEAIEHENNSTLRFSTELVSKLLKQNNLKYKVDEDGDIMVEHEKASGKNVNWFVWYLISPSTLTLDSGCTDIPKDFDIDNFEEQLQKAGGALSRMVKVTKSQNGSLRLKCSIEATTPENVVEEWDAKHTILENLWGGIYELVEYSKEQEAERQRLAAERERKAEIEAREEELDASFTYKLRSGGTVRGLQEAFTEDYPYLRIGVYMVKTGQSADRNGGEISSYDSDTSFGDIRSFKGDCVVEIEGRSTPQSLEKQFREVSGLVIKICYNDEDDKRYYISKDDSEYKKHICDINREFREAGYNKADIS